MSLDCKSFSSLIFLQTLFTRPTYIRFAYCPCSICFFAVVGWMVESLISDPTVTIKSNRADQWPWLLGLWSSVGKPILNSDQAAEIHLANLIRRFRTRAPLYRREKSSFLVVFINLLASLWLIHPLCVWTKLSFLFLIIWSSSKFGG